MSGAKGPEGRDDARSRALIASFRSEYRLAELWRLSLRPDVDPPAFARALLDEGTRLLDFTSATLFRVDADGTVTETASIVTPHDQPMLPRVQQQARQSVDADVALRRMDDGGPISLLVPIHVAGEDLVLAFWCRLRSRVIDQTDLDFATFLGGVYTDFVARRAHTDAVSFLAFNDALTGLPNRTGIRRKLDETLATASRNDRRAALLFIDIDGFKIINDRLGHESGDLALREIARRFSATLRAGEFIGRHGGDEFAAIIPDLQREEDTLEVANRLIDAMAAPFELDSQHFQLSASVGIAIYPTDGRSPSDLLQNGDSAMYRAKQQGGGRVFLFSAHVRDELETRRRLVRDLRSAAMSREFLVCYQPIVETQTERVVGAEALVRWLHPSDGLLSAESFLGPINSPHLVALIDAWMIAQTMNQSLKWMGLRNPLKIHVNIARPDRAIIGEIDRVLAGEGIDPSLLNIEMNEAAVLGDLEVALTFIEECRSRGLRVGLDRFGAGASSLQSLTRLSVDFVKLDQGLLTSVSRRGESTAAVSAAIAVADAFGWHIIAQGVASDVQRHWLAERGVSEAQGYGIGQPMTAVDFERWLAASDRAVS